MASRNAASHLVTTIALATFVALGVAGCSSTVTKHGHQFQDSDLQQIQPGMSREQVRGVLGTPTSTSSLNQGNAFYYISSTMTQTAFMSAKETDRRVVAVYFTEAGTVERVAEYGVKDGRVFDFVSSSTPPANARDEGIIRQLFRNLGTRTLLGE